MQPDSVERRNPLEHDLAVIVVSHDQARWLAHCLPTVLEHAGDVALDLVVVENGHTPETADLVAREFPSVRLVVTENRGFANANNVGLATCSARWILFLNPDTELRGGSLAGLVHELDARPEVGIAGVRQVDASGSLTPTVRRFPTPARTLGDALGFERLPGRPAWLGERELRRERYDRELDAEWTIGSFMLARREALDAVGGFDERFFLYSEEVDLCLRVSRAGWRIVHLPTLTILHHGSSGRALDPRLASQSAWAQLQYVRKHEPGSERAFRAALLVRYGLRSFHPDARRRGAAREAAALLLGLRRPPFEQTS